MYNSVREKHSTSENKIRYLVLYHASTVRRQRDDSDASVCVLYVCLFMCACLRIERDPRGFTTKTRY